MFGKLKTFLSFSYPSASQIGLEAGIYKSFSQDLVIALFTRYDTEVMSMLSR